MPARLSHANRRLSAVRTTSAAVFTGKVCKRNTAEPTSPGPSPRAMAFLITRCIMQWPSPAMCVVLRSEIKGRRALVQPMGSRLAQLVSRISDSSTGRVVCLRMGTVRMLRAHFQQRSCRAGQSTFQTQAAQNGCPAPKVAHHLCTEDKHTGHNHHHRYRRVPNDGSLNSGCSINGDSVYKMPSSLVLQPPSSTNSFSRTVLQAKILSLNPKGLFPYVLGTL